MKKYLLLVLLLCVVVLASGCAGNKANTIKLEGNPTTGYTWIYIMEPEGVVREVSNDYVMDKNPKNANGVGGTFIFKFEAVAPGEAELVFSYLRTWEEDVPPVETVVYIATVDSNSKLTLKEK